MANPTSRGQQRDKPFRDALRLEIAAAQGKRHGLRHLAAKLIRKAEFGDVQAIKEIADRLDGKPAQAVEMSGSLAVSHEEALNELDGPGAEDPAPAS